MDEGIIDDVTSMDAIDPTHLQIKEREYPLPGSSNLCYSREMVIPIEGGNHDRAGSSEHACASSRCVNDANDMVAELTIRTYNGENLADGVCKNRERAQIRQNQWQHLYKKPGESENGSPLRDGGKDKHGSISGVWEDMGYTIFPEYLGQKIPKDDGNKATDNLMGGEDKFELNSALLSSGGIRTKILSKSGLSEYFVKNTLKGKGIVYRSPANEKTPVGGAKAHLMAAHVARDSEAPEPNLGMGLPPLDGILNPWPSLNSDSSNVAICLREWLKAGINKVNKVETLCIFKQIVDLVDTSHSQGVTLKDLRPSCLKLSSSKQIVYHGSFVRKEIPDNNPDHDMHHVSNDRSEKKSIQPDMLCHGRQSLKKQKRGNNMEFTKQMPQFPSRSGFRSSAHSAFNASERQTQLTSLSDPEDKWYASPEDVSGSSWTFASNVYSLGVLLFELLGSFESERAHTVAMLNLRHRILPPDFLSENPKEAGFCLWLLHPEPSSRPTTREVLQSEVIDGVQVSSGDDFSSSVNQKDAELELLLHFLFLVKEQKQKDATNLVEEISCIKSDIEEVVSRRLKRSSIPSFLKKDFLQAGSDLELFSSVTPTSNYGLGLTKNIRQLESAYFSMRSTIQLSGDDAARQTDRDLLRHRESCFEDHHDDCKQETSDRVGIFFNGLCKYARYSKFEVHGILRNGDLNHSANVICSLSFNRDEEYFATAGVSKKIKIYEFPNLFDDSVDIHYPVVELSNKSKLSCVCWNSYISNYLASTDYEGIVKLWDSGTGQEFSKYIEHDKRAWSVDFSQTDPTKLASGGDDCSVKLWSINEKSSLCSIRNIANVCCVQFSTGSSHLLSFGSADYKTYCYDLRNVSTPWCILAGHHKAVSFVKFLDSKTIVSASTDNTLKIWDLSKTSSHGLSTNACTLTLKGHTNEKNFVGLSVADGYIACGSETNEVFSYVRSLPMPITSHKFGSIDPITGKETDDDNGQFVTSVCWRKKSHMVVAANSSGCIKLLQMV